MQTNLFIRSDNSFLFSAITFSVVVVAVAVFFLYSLHFSISFYITAVAASDAHASHIYVMFTMFVTHMR